MFQPVQKDFTLVRGTYGYPASITAVLKDSQGTLINLAGAKFYLSARRNRFFLDKSSDDGSLVIDLNASSITFTPSEEEVKSVPPGRSTPYLWRIVFANGSGQTFLTGYFIGAASLEE